MILYQTTIKGFGKTKCSTYPLFVLRDFGRKKTMEEKRERKWSIILSFFFFGCEKKLGRREKKMVGPTSKVFYSKLR